MYLSKVYQAFVQALCAEKDGIESDRLCTRAGSRLLCKRYMGIQYMWGNNALCGAAAVEVYSELSRSQVGSMLFFYDDDPRRRDMGNFEKGNSEGKGREREKDTHTRINELIIRWFLESTRQGGSRLGAGGITLSH